MEMIREYSDNAAAYIDRGLLKNYGIQSEVVPGDLSGIFPGASATQLYVKAADAAKARALLNGH